MKLTLLDFSLEGQVPYGRRIMTGFGSDFHDCLPEPYVLRYSEASNSIWFELLGNTVSSHAMRASSMLATAELTRQPKREKILLKAHSISKGINGKFLTATASMREESL